MTYTYAEVNAAIAAYAKRFRAGGFYCHRQAMKVALEAAAAARWQPIESAPKDGTIIDVWLDGCSKDDMEFYCTKGTYRSPGWSWVRGKFRPCGGLGVQVPTFVYPTHWMPLPKPPK